VSRATSALALAATARAALAVARSVADRRAGRDASAQEDAPVAAADLAVLRTDLAGVAVQLRLRAVLPPPADADAATAHAMETRWLVQDAARALALAHRKQLSLYPAVDAEAVEATRRLARDASDEVTASSPAVGSLADRIAAWSACG